jgi:hypothetical protein
MHVAIIGSGHVGLVAGEIGALLAEPPTMRDLGFEYYCVARSAQD